MNYHTIKTKPVSTVDPNHNIYLSPLFGLALRVALSIALALFAFAFALHGGGGGDRIGLRVRPCLGHLGALHETRRHVLIWRKMMEMEMEMEIEMEMETIECEMKLRCGKDADQERR